MAYCSRFRRRLRSCCRSACLFAVASRRPSPRKLRPARRDRQAAAPANSPPRKAYTLPPDKLAKAIALSRIRNILDIAGSLWGLAVLWLLLATRAAAGIEAWAQRISQRRWLQGLLFFAAFLVHHHAGRPAARLYRPPRRAAPTASACRAGQAGSATRARRSRSRARHRRARSAALQLDRAPLAAPLLARRLAGHAAHSGPRHVRRAARRAPLQQVRAALARTTPPRRRSSKRSSPAPEPTFRPTACS